MTEFRIIDLQTETIDPAPKTVVATSPERAAELALGVKLVRSGAKQNLRARVYSQHPGEPLNMGETLRQGGRQPPQRERRCPVTRPSHCFSRTNR